MMRVLFGKKSAPEVQHIEEVIDDIASQSSHVATENLVGYWLIIHNKYNILQYYISQPTQKSATPPPTPPTASAPRSPTPLPPTMPPADTQPAANVASEKPTKPDSSKSKRAQKPEPAKPQSLAELLEQLDKERKALYSTPLKERVAPTSSSPWDKDDGPAPKIV